MTAPNQRKHALVIDDDSDIRELLHVLLEGAGFEVDVLADGIDALTLAKPYSVILLDMKMPIFDGAHLTDYWRLTDPSILNRVIVLSGYSRFARDKELTTFASVPKPFDCVHLLQVVNDCVQKHEVVNRESP